MTDLADGESTTMQGSGRRPYTLKNTGGVYSCTCPAWRNQSEPIERRTCKHLRKLRGEQAERERLGAPLPERARAVASQDAPELLLAHSWEEGHDPTGWWMSEKLDGVRAYWNGQEFLSRRGNLYLSPQWFLQGLPAFALDGELWIGRGEFQRTVSVVRRQDESEHWRQVSFLVFDAPDLEAPFEERLAHVREHFAAHPHPQVTVLEHTRCEGAENLREELARVEALGGEGLMLREPGSRYVAGRSTTLLKVKSFLDAEARVVAYKAGAGRHKGRVGALEVITPSGVEFAVGTGLTDAQREQPPPIGAIISYRYQELTQDGVPRFPSYLGVREDVTWPADEAAHTEEIAPPAAEPAAALEDGELRRLEFRSGSSEKFWEVRLDADTVHVRYGKIGSDGRSTNKTLATAEAALAYANKKMGEKSSKGYVVAPPE